MQLSIVRQNMTKEVLGFSLKLCLVNGAYIFEMVNAFVDFSNEVLLTP